MVMNEPCIENVLGNCYYEGDMRKSPRHNIIFSQLFSELLECKVVILFTFSDEEDTLANTMQNKVSKKIAKQRMKEIMKLQQEISLKLNENRINQVHDVLIEDVDGNNYYGRSYLYAPDAEDGNFIIHSNKNLIIGEFVKVKITKVNAYDVEGEL